MLYFFSDKNSRVKVGDKNYFGKPTIFSAIKESGNYDMLCVTDSDGIVVKVIPLNAVLFIVNAERALREAVGLTS